MVIDPGSSLNSHSASAGKARGQVAEKTDAATRKPDAATSATDNVSLSSASQSLAKIEAKIDTIPDVDSAKVAEVKAAIASGSYRIDSDAIAGKIQEQEQLFG